MRGVMEPGTASQSEATPESRGRAPSSDQVSAVTREATRQIDLDDLREPNEFDVKLLQLEGKEFGKARVRGGRLVATGPAKAISVATAGLLLRPPPTKARTSVRPIWVPVAIGLGIGMAVSAIAIAVALLIR